MVAANSLTFHLGRPRPTMTSPSSKTHSQTLKEVERRLTEEPHTHEIVPRRKIAASKENVPPSPTATRRNANRAPSKSSSSTYSDSNESVVSLRQVAPVKPQIPVKAVPCHPADPKPSNSATTRQERKAETSAKQLKEKNAILQILKSADGAGHSPSETTSGSSSPKSISKSPPTSKAQLSPDFTTQENLPPSPGHLQNVREQPKPSTPSMPPPILRSSSTKVTTARGYLKTALSPSYSHSNKRGRRSIRESPLARKSLTVPPDTSIKDLVAKKVKASKPSPSKQRHLWARGVSPSSPSKQRHQRVRGLSLSSPDKDETFSVGDEELCDAPSTSSTRITRSRKRRSPPPSPEGDSHMPAAGAKKSNLKRTPSYPGATEQSPSPIKVKKRVSFSTTEKSVKPLPAASDGSKDASNLAFSSLSSSIDNAISSAPMIPLPPDAQFEPDLQANDLDAQLDWILEEWPDLNQPYHETPTDDDDRCFESLPLPLKDDDDKLFEMLDHRFDPHILEKY